MTEKAKCKICTNEKELIEEMAKIIYENRPIKDIWIEDATEIAKVLLSAGYRKPLEGSVVLSKEQNEKWLEWLEQNIEKARKEALEKIKLIPIECGEECGHYYLDISVTGKELLQRVYFTSSFIDGKIRKETAKEILQLVKEKSWCYEEDENGEAWTYSITVTELKELAQGYGVEVEDDG